MKTIVVATKNRGKLREIQAALAGLDLKIRSLDDFPSAPEVVEDGETFAENAGKKARAIAAHTGLPALADDSGLAVDALGGAPGVFSARYAGETADDAANNRKLLAALQNVPPAKRTARFVCVLALAFPGGRTVFAEGFCEGRIIDSLKGEGGFGYDPVFFSPELGITFAEATREQKLSVSHRGRALTALGKKIAVGDFLSTFKR
jgi:XTP/dITP diphosphohydrolase